MDEYAYSKEDIDIGTVFAYNGRVVTATEVIGYASGSCTIASEENIDYTCCDFYLQLYGSHGSGPVALTGNTDEIGGRMEVTGAGGDFSNQGYADLLFDPAGYAIIYTLIQFY